MLKYKSINNQSGLSLIQLLITSAVGVITLSGAMTLFVYTSSFGNDNLSFNRLNYTLLNVLNSMSSDIRRAGFWGNASADIGRSANTNPFMTSTTDISVNASNNCILLTYDFDQDGVLANIGSAIIDEHFGYRLQGSAMQARPSTGDYDCNAITSNWINITNPNDITISNLTLTKNDTVIDLDGAGPGTETITVRDIDISITGYLTKDPSITQTLTDSITVRNDLYAA